MKLNAPYHLGGPENNIERGEWFNTISMLKVKMTQLRQEIMKLDDQLSKSDQTKIDHQPRKIVK